MITSILRPAAAFLDTDLIHVLEEVLPNRFGGGPTDSQVVEEDRTDEDRRCGSSCTPGSARWRPPRR
jgi:hypothetical protein